ncbi:MAG: IS21 family transposase [Thermoleophilaceae bacterium]
MLREMSMQIKFLTRQGVSKAEIARRYGVSRQTVYNHLNRTGSFPRPRPPRGSKLDPFKAYVRSRLKEFNLPATVLCREIGPRGYTGGLTILRQFIRPLKAELTRRVIERFETVPGRQAQIDWGECGTITVGGERKTLYLFAMVLGYSRMSYARFTTSSKLPTLLKCLAKAFERLGIPAEILVDNMKQAVESHDVATGSVRWNRSFLDFAEHHGFLPVACPPYWPQAKGKVERGIGYIKTSFLEGRSFTDLADLNHQLDVWLDTVANVRVHGTTGERPVDRHARELGALRSFAAVPAYDTRPVEIRIAHRDSHIRYAGVDYSIDPQAVGHSVTLRPEGEAVGDAFSVYLGEQIVARHHRRRKGTGRVTLSEHAAAIRRLTRGGTIRSQGRKQPPRFVQLATPAETAWVERLGRIAPDVEVRELAVYERLAEAG